MRVISGTARGKRLAVFSGSAIRPTPDKVRGAIFSMIFSRIGSFTDKKVLDLCSGTGAMAIEALSRGAKHAWMVDDGVQSAQIIPANLSGCGFSERATFLRCSAAQALPQLLSQRPFDLIFLDPPYGKGVAAQLIEKISAGDFLCNNGIVCVETAKTDELADEVGQLFRESSRNYGITTIHLYLHSEAKATS